MIKTVKHSADLCIIGGGLSGICAAVSAARGGSSVVLMHERPMLGGNASSEIRMWVCGAQGKGNRETGIIEEIALRNLKYNPEKKYPIWDALLLDLVQREKNITLLLNCSCFDAKCDGKQIISVLGWQMTTQEKHLVEAKLFADCSGDSILGALCGAEFRMGRECADEFGERISVKEADTQTMGMSCLIQARYDENTESEFIAPPNAMRMTDEMMALRTPKMDDTYENFWYLELGGDRDCISDTESIRDELISMALGMWDWIKNSGKVVGAEHWHLDFLGMLPGKRESRRLMGKHILTQSDVLSGGEFSDVIAYGGWGLDDHHPNGFYHKGNPNTWGNTPSPYGIPYRCVYSRNIENLFFAGRNISTTHAALSSTRTMATCALLGEAVGTAADIAREYSLSPQGVYEQKTELLQSRLMENGCFLPYKKRNTDTAKAAMLLSDTDSASDIEALRNGIDRNNRTYENTEQGCSLSAGSTVTYTFEKQKVDVIHIAFDSDLDRTTLPGDECERYHSMRCNLLPSSPVMHMPLTLVRSFCVTAVLQDGNESVLYEDSENIKQTVNIYPRRELSSISLHLFSNYGGSDKIRVFSFDFR